MTRWTWLCRIAEASGAAGEADIPSGASAATAWEAVSAGYGMQMAALVRAVADFFSLEVADLTVAQATAQKFLPESVARQYLVYPLEDLNVRLMVATANPTDVQAEGAVGFASGRTTEFRVASPVDIEAAVDAAYSPDRAAEAIVEGLSDSSMAEIELLAVTKHDREAALDVGGPVVRLTNMLLARAVEAGASDLHIQPTDGGGVARIRVDGVMRTLHQMPMPVLTRIVSRIKALANMDLADRLRPQDGRARVQVGDSTYDLRVSVVPTRGTEKAVLRILDTGSATAIEDVGIDPNDLDALTSMIQERNGVVLVTGPTGSGKTTTLYALLKVLATDDVNVMTVEDPVENQMAGLTQIQVETAQGVTFASALRAVLRQDPDIVFVGEIRDQETAEVVVHASSTGHLVLSTLHTNDAVGTLERLGDLGLDGHVLAANLRGVVAQRLLRRVCEECAVSDPDHAGRRKSVGCESCDWTGYRGRIPVMEVFRPTPALQSLVHDGAPHHEVVRKAHDEGMRSLRDAALVRVDAGETTEKEAARVLGAHDAAPAPGVEVEAPRLEEQPLDFDETPCVMVVDDNAPTRTVAKALLESDGFRVLEAEDGVAALELLKRGHHFSAMLLDLSMPRMDGDEVLKHVRSNVETAGLPVLVLTASSDPAREIELLRLGADDYLQKPIEPERFMLRVQAVLRRAAG